MTRPVRTRRLSHVIVAATLLALSTAACASVPKAAPEADLAAKSFTPTPGKSRIYVVRPKAFKGAAVTLNAILDGKELGRVSNGTYLMTEVDPGTHTIGSRTLETTLGDSVVTEANRSYFFIIKPRMGVIAARVGLEATTAAEGRAEVMNATRVESAF